MQCEINVKSMRMRAPGGIRMSFVNSRCCVDFLTRFDSSATGALHAAWISESEPKKYAPAAFPDHAAEASKEQGINALAFNSKLETFCMCFLSTSLTHARWSVPPASPKAPAWQASPPAWLAASARLELAWMAPRHSGT